ncbi:peptidase family M3 containing protein [Loa loa]|uniref:Peptidase family M3 containing protein n=1 Tax=Loa loa TaxID=7209 RepID=A0A1S0U4R1_LOALO|nr:peptidase family M3 containing protein [Loa loa]EFO25150.2 peptidase family M3 containing protein [Loa loa]
MVSVVTRRAAWFGRILSKDAAIPEPSTSRWISFGSKRAISLSNTYRYAGYYAIFPIVPNATPENNRFVANVCSAEDWPALCTPPKEMYEGTVRMLLEYGATMHEHMKLLEGMKPEDLTFENVIGPFLAEEEQVVYAFHTLWTKMVTDWPISSELHADFMKTLCERNETTDRWKRRLADFYYLQMKSAAMGETSKKHEQFAGHDSFVENYILRYRMVLRNSEDMENIQVTDRTVFKDAPPEVLRILAVNRTKYEEGPWLVAATARSLKPILTYCSDKALRATVWDKWISRAAKPNNLARVTSNARTIETIRRHQGKKAALLGFGTYAEYRLAYKMAESPKIVRKFTKALARRMRPLFDDRMQAWSSFAAEEEKLYTLAPSDLYYICRKEAESLHEIDSLDLMYHFPFWPTFENILEVLSYIFGLLFEDVTSSNLDRCHPDIRIFSVTDSSGLHLGRLYVDPFERTNKCCTWDALLGRSYCAENRWDKIVYLFANLSISGSLDSSALLHYEELQNLLFHTGRAMQLLLSQSPYRDLIVPWKIFHAHDMDAVDLLPTVMQFFIFKPVLLAALSCKHLKTGEALSENKANNIALGLSRSTFYETYRALFWTDFDLTLFDTKDTDQVTWQEIYHQKLTEYFAFKNSKGDMQPCSFAPIFGKSMSMAVYYSRLWAEMLAFDIHDTFEKEDDVCATGDRLKKAILFEGASQPQRELYRRFQGRDPSPDAMCDFYDPPQYHISIAVSNEDTTPYLDSDIQTDTEKLGAK